MFSIRSGSRQQRTLSWKWRHDARSLVPVARADQSPGKTRSGDGFVVPQCRMSGTPDIVESEPRPDRDIVPAIVLVPVCAENLIRLGGVRESAILAA